MEQVLHFKFKADGKELILGDANVQALSLEDLLSFEKNYTFKLKINGAILDKSSAEKTERVDVSASFSSEYTNQCFALVRSGWLPPVFALNNSLILPDRNIITDISRRFHQGEVVSKGQQLDFIDLIVAHDYQAQISLAPFALEGNLRRRPTSHEVILQLEEASQKISQALPNLHQTPINDLTITGIMGLLEDSHDQHHKRLEFLMSTIHLLGNTAGKMRRSAVWKEIFDLASQAGLDRADFCVITAIIAVTAPNNCNPARGIFKPKPNYTEQDAYNSLCDIQLLSLYIHALHNFPNEKHVLLTKDTSMAKLWAGMAPLTTSRKPPLVNCDFQISRSLFPIDEYWSNELHALMSG